MYYFKCNTWFNACSGASVNIYREKLEQARSFNPDINLGLWKILHDRHWHPGFYLYLLASYTLQY